MGKNKTLVVNWICGIAVTLLCICLGTVKVSAKEKSINLNKSELSLIIGNTATLKAETIGIKGDVVWTTSNKKVATVKNGKVTAKCKGICYITASVGKISQKCKVYVYTDEILASDFMVSGVLDEYNQGTSRNDLFDNLNKTSSMCAFWNYSISCKDFLACEVSEIVKTKRGITLGMSDKDVLNAYGTGTGLYSVDKSTDGFLHVVDIYPINDDFDRELASIADKAVTCVAYSYKKNSKYQIRFYFNKKGTLILIGYVKGYSDSTYLSINNMESY